MKYFLIIYGRGVFPKHLNFCNFYPLDLYGSQYISADFQWPVLRSNWTFVTFIPPLFRSFLIQGHIVTHSQIHVFPLRLFDLLFLMQEHLCTVLWFPLVFKILTLCHFITIVMHLHDLCSEIVSIGVTSVFWSAFFLSSRWSTTRSFWSLTFFFC